MLARAGRLGFQCFMMIMAKLNRYSGAVDQRLGPAGVKCYYWGRGTVNWRIFGVLCLAGDNPENAPEMGRFFFVELPMVVADGLYLAHEERNNTLGPVYAADCRNRRCKQEKDMVYAGSFVGCQRSQYSHDVGTSTVLSPGILHPHMD